MLEEWRRGVSSRLLGSRLPVVLAGMGGVARSELVAAVTAAGGFGFLGMVREPTALIEREVLAVRAQGHERFGVNIIPAATPGALLDAQLETILRLRVPVVALFWDIDERVIGRLRDAGIVVVHQVGSVEEAVAAQQAGAQIIVAQGVEAGGHVRGITPLRDLLTQMVEAVTIPVLAAGGLATGGDLVTALALGAEGIVLGTALMASQESFAHDYHKQRLVEAHAADTELTTRFHINWPPNAPVRVISSTAASALASQHPDVPRLVIGDEDGRPIHLYSTDSPLRSMTGNFAAMALYAGAGLDAITTIPPAAERIAQLMENAERIGGESSREAVDYSSGVCFANEFSGDYMGQASDEETAACLAMLVASLAEALRLALDGDRATTSRPPFPAAAADYAAWLLKLRRLARTMPQSPSAAVSEPDDLVRLRIAMLDRLESLLPRLPDTSLRQQLTGLASFLRTEQARHIVRAPPV
jgi:nitronate monooxygenase